MANTLATTAVVARESLAILKNMLVFSKGVNRSWESEFGSNMARGYATGQTINIKQPPRYTYRAGRVAVPQSTVFNTVPLTLSQGGCDINFPAHRAVGFDQQSRLAEGDPRCRGDRCERDRPPRPGTRPHRRLQLGERQ
jgi:hypothetical protein